MTAKQQQSYHTVDDVAEMIGVDPALVYREIRRGRLAAYRIGGRVLRVSDSDLQRYLQQQRTSTGAPA